MQGVVVGRLQQRPDELPSRGVHAVVAQLRVGLEGAAVEVRHGVLAQTQLAQAVALLEQVAAATQGPVVQVAAPSGWPACLLARFLRWP